MSDLSLRLAHVEAVQHFQNAMLGALAKACQDLPGFKEHLRESLLRHHALLIAESDDEVRLKAYEDLMERALGA